MTDDSGRLTYLKDQWPRWGPGRQNATGKHPATDNGTNMNQEAKVRNAVKGKDGENANRKGRRNEVGDGGGLQRRRGQYEPPVPRLLGGEQRKETRGNIAKKKKSQL